MSKEKRVYLNCPFDEKDLCKGAGGRWDPDMRMWYVPKGDDPNMFKRWLPKNKIGRRLLITRNFYTFAMN